MIILGIDTSTTVTTVCIGDEGGAIAAASLSTPRSHAEFLLPAVRFCLDQSGMAFDRIAGIAVGLGPGLYTGMRVGIATAQSLAHAARLPCVGLGSLDVLAYRARTVASSRLLCAVLDARRGEAFWALYRPCPTGVQRTTEFRVGPPEKLAGELEASADDVLCLGDGALRYRQLLESAGAAIDPSPDAHPDARDLVQLALPRFVREDTQRPEALQPIYLREADARISWRNRGALFGGVAAAPEGVAR